MFWWNTLGISKKYYLNRGRRVSVEKDLIDYWGNSTAETIDIAAFNFAMAFAMDNATIEHPAVVYLRKINFKK